MPRTMLVDWENCPFHSTAIPSLQGLRGVYLIWEFETLHILRLGRGNLAERIQKHLGENELRLHGIHELAAVRYAVVPNEREQAGLERWLVRLLPDEMRLGHQVQDVEPIKPLIPPFLSSSE